MQYAQRVILNEDRTTKPAQLHGILQQGKIFRPISSSRIEYRGNKIRCFDLCSLQGAHYRKLIARKYGILGRLMILQSRLQGRDSTLGIRVRLTA